MPVSPVVKQSFRVLTGLLVGGVLFLKSPDARAEKNVSAGFAWGIVTLQLSVATALPLIAHTNPPWVRESAGTLALTGAALGVSVGGGLLAYHLGATPRSAHTAQGLLWGAFGGGLLGAALGGNRRELRFGATAVVMGTLGAASGGLLGAYLVNQDATQLAWLTGPGLGASLGTLVSTLGAALSNTDDAERWIAIGASSGALLGLAVSAPLSRSPGPLAPARTQQAPLSLSVQGTF